MKTSLYLSFRKLANRFQKIAKLLLSATLFCNAIGAQAVNLTPLPPYLTETKGAPMVMLNVSKDHQLFYKAYNEFTDLDGDGQPETSYKHGFKYYGYFDNHRCYVYSTTNNRFSPTRKENAATATDPTYCGGTDEWHGNFLNWATMTRMDVVRRILYGGYRSTDNTVVSGSALTVLERAHLPTDAHAFAKYYSGTDIRKLTPFTPSTGEISICNASFKNDRYSHNAISAPSMLVANGNFSLWNANERWQCYWSEDKNASNSNDPTKSFIYAASSNPSRATKGLGSGYATGSYTVRVEVCKSGLEATTADPTGFTTDEESKCKYYPLGSNKPVGLLQKYGERNEAAFGLITGSFAKNTSGGVLRKNVATFTNEVNLDDGRFTGVDGIVSTMNKLRMYGYDYNDGTYINADGCSYQQIGLSDGTCVSWGNPMGEMYLEALRYLAGKTASAAFTYNSTGSKDAALGLTIATWSDPFDTSTTASFGDRLCRRSSIVNFNASVTSYDNDQWSGQSDIAGLGGATTVDGLTDAVGNSEGLYASGTTWSIGSTSGSTNNMCNQKTMTSLSSSIGICPEAPTYAGGFKMAGAALFAHTNPIRSDIPIPANNTTAFKVDTYGVALSTSTPRIKVPVPGQTGKYVVILPAYRLDKGAAGQGGGTLVDFRVVSQSATAANYLIQWEDSEQGGDYDQDVWGTLSYSVVGSNILISTQVIGESTNQKQGFGYVVSGTSGKDGVHFHSGIEGFNYTDPVNISATPTTKLNASGGCSNCQAGEAKTTATYAMTGVSGDALQDPLWYAAKYGGFDRTAAPTYSGASAVAGTPIPAAAWDAKKTDGSAGSDGIPDNFFYAIDPSQLETSLEQIFTTILKAGGAAPAAATSSRTASGGYVYVSTESVKAADSSNDADASGEFLKYGFNADGTVSGAAEWDAGAKLTNQVLSGGWDTNRRVFTMHETTGPTTFRWGSLSLNQTNALKQNPALLTLLDSDTVGQNRLNWIRGESANETTAGGLRKRTKTKLGAIINSTPWFIGAPSAGYTDAEFGTGYTAFRRNAVNAARNSVAVGANDGMLHIFDATSGVEQFAYVPRAMYDTSSTAPYSKLSALTAKDFLITSGTNRLTVDGSLMAADINLSASTTPNWRTYLFGSFGRGAQGVYALDVTSPQTITAETTANAAAVVKWEFTSKADSDFGYVTGRTNPKNNGQPWQTGYMANGKWAAIYGNGYNSASGKAALFIIFANGPTTTDPVTGWTTGTYVKILTGPLGLGPDNGLATPTAVDTNNDGKIDVIYAGDLKGNVWKFDVSSSNTANWAVATQASATDTTKVPVFTATTTLPSPSTGTVNQPITTAVVPFVHPQGGYQLFFGTGKALESTDYPMTTLYSQTLYGIYDKPGTVGSITTGKTDLVEQTSTTSGGIRYFSQNSVNYPSKKGWYLNLPVSSESVVFNPFSEDSYRVNVKSLAPQATSNGCRYDATSFEAIINPINGLPIPNLMPSAPLVTGYGAVGETSTNSFEFSRGGVYPSLTPPPSTTSCVAGSTNCTCNPANSSECVLCPDPATCNPPWKPLPQNQCMYRTISALGNGTVTSSERFGACSAGRLTWREILRNR